MSSSRKSSASPVPQLKASVFPLALGVNPPAEEKNSQSEEWLEAFEKDFWEAYPHKFGKFMARKAWLRIRPWSQKMIDEVIDGLDRWNRYWNDHQTEKRFIPYPATWLNQHRWEDSPE